MIKIYNTLKRKKEILFPIKDNKINLFVCGPTVYDFSHIGHARTYIFFDTFATYLKKMGYEVFYLQNITDVDDKIIKRAKEKNVPFKEIARKFEREYKKDIKSLKIDSVTKYARATDHIKEIQSQIKRLIEKGFAYQIDDGIYFDIKKFKNYGKLSRRTVIQANDSTSRIDNARKKRNKGDFCLWKFNSPKKTIYEPSWQSPWGKGRPGWHIEDTAIAEKYFGFQYDIHGGAQDLIFPHHEAEIAQMEAISGKSPFVKYWMHTGFLTIKGQKMSKSLKNFITIREFIKENSPEVLRMFILSSHYRSPIDYNQEIISQTKETLKRIVDFKEKIGPYKKIKNFQDSPLFLKLNKILENDFNAPEFFGEFFEIIKFFNKKNSLSEKEKRDIGGVLDFLESVFKIFKEKKEKVPQKIITLLKKREKARKEKNWELADKIREEIEKMGYWIEDTKNGPRLKEK
jgi:cysteinyl-tRNA synthetase